MALWVELPVGNSRCVRWAGRLAWACGATGAAVSVQATVFAGAPSASGWLAGFIVAIAMLGSGLLPLLRRLGLRPPVHHAVGAHLCVDSLGEAFLRAAGGMAVPLTIRHVHRGLGILWVDAMGDGHRYRLLSGADLAGDAQWQRSAAWIQWLRRGVR